MVRSRGFTCAAFLMCVTVTLSNILVQYPFYFWGLENLLTYGAFVYPFAFLVNDLTNRRFGPRSARRVVCVGFLAGLVVSWLLAIPRLALASGLAFLFAQLLDIIVFTPLRRKTWWKAPLAAAVAGSCLDTVLFFSIAFSGTFGFIDTLTGYPNQSIPDLIHFFNLTIPVWVSLAAGDFLVKIVMALFMLVPYGAILVFFIPSVYTSQKN